MSQAKLNFKITKLRRSARPGKNQVSEIPAKEDVVPTDTTPVNSPLSKRKYVSSPDTPTSDSKTPPRTGYTKAKRAGKRMRTIKTHQSSCRTLLDFMSAEKQPVAEQVEKEMNEEMPTQEAVPTVYQTPAHDEEMTPLPPVMEDKAVQQDNVVSAKSFFKKVLVPKEDTIEGSGSKPTKVLQSTGARMLAASLAKKKEGVPAHRNEVIRALAARSDLCHRHKTPVSTSNKPTPSSLIKPSNEVQESGLKTPTKLTARERFSHLLQPKSPKIKSFKEISVTSPVKSPSKGEAPPGLILPETHKKLCYKFNTSDQVINLLTRRLETCTFGKLQKNVQEICRKKFNEDDLGHIVGNYPQAYILAQCKGLAQIRNERMIRNEYQLTVAFNYAETENVKKIATTDIFSLHPTIKTEKTTNPNHIDSNISAQEKFEQETLKAAQQKAKFNQRGLLAAEVLERSRRFKAKMLSFVRAKHQEFLGTLVPVLKIDDNKLVRWHPEFDLNSLELPPAGEIPKPPESSRILTAAEMIVSIDSNKAIAPPGMENAVEKSYQKILSEKEKEAEKKADQLKDIDPNLLARIRAKEAKKMAEKMMRDPAKDKELSMLQHLDKIVRCLRVLYVGAGRGSLLLNEVCADLSTNKNINLTPQTVDQHIRLLTGISPKWLSVVNLRKKEYLKLNRNMDIKIVLDAVKSRENQYK